MRLAVTMGDPAGIGPEILVKAWRQMQGARVAYGDLATLVAAADRWAPDLTVSIDGPDDQPNWMRVEQTAAFSGPLGQVSASAGASSFDALALAVDHALSGDIQGVVTAPINKAAWAQAGIEHPGHTEYLAQRARCPVAMVLANDDLAVILATVHCSMIEAVEQIRAGAVDRVLPHAWQAALELGFETPRIAVAGLNPHAGEGGLFGQEEIEHIIPAIQSFGRSEVTGPYPGDTVFMRARSGEFDLVVAMTHDQGLIPVKYLGVENGVNFTAGLPFVRTSPDHGTAFEIAGQGVADERAMLYAYQQAHRILNRRSANS